MMLQGCAEPVDRSQAHGAEVITEADVFEFFADDYGPIRETVIQ
jgi:hypothetical protein